MQVITRRFARLTATGFFGLLSTICLVPGSAMAGQYNYNPVCTSDSFGTYESQGSCTAGTSDLLLYNFDLYTIGANSSLQPADQALLDSLMVTPVWDQNAGTLALTVSGFAPVGAAESAAYQIRFTVDPAPVLGGEAVAMDPPFGNVTGTQSYCSDEAFNTDNQSLCASSAIPGLLTFSIGNPASVTFPSALTTFTARTNLYLNPNLDTASGIDAVIFSFQTTEGSAPEPATWSLMALAGLAGLAAAGPAVAGRRFRLR